MSKSDEHWGFEKALDEIAVTGTDYHIADTPQRLLELSQTANVFMNVAVAKKVTPDELRLTVALFSQYASKWIRENERR